MKRTKKISNRHSSDHDDAWHPRDWYYNSSHSWQRRTRFDKSWEAKQFLDRKGADYSIYHQSNKGTGFMYPKECDILIGESGPLEFRIRVWPEGLGGYEFIGEIKEKEAEPDMHDLPGRKSRVDANKYFARGQHFYCSNLEKFKEAWESALEEYAIPMRSRTRRSRAKKDGYEYFRTKQQMENSMRTTVPKLRQIIRQVIKESMGDGTIHDTWGVGARNARASRKPTLPETLEVCEIIRSHGGNCNTNVYAPGEEYSDQHREVTTGRVGDAVVVVTVTPNSFSAQISEGEKGYEKAELPGQKGHVNPNDFFAQGQNFNCYSIEEFEQCLQSAMTDYSRPMRSRARRSGARKAGYEHFRTR